MNKNHLVLAAIFSLVPCSVNATKLDCQETYRTQPSFIASNEKIVITAYQSTVNLDTLKSIGAHETDDIENCSSDASYACWDDGATVISIPKNWRGEKTTWTQSDQTFIVLPEKEVQILGKRLKVFPVVSFMKSDKEENTFLSAFLYDEDINLIALGDFRENEKISWSWAVGNGMPKKCLVR